MAHYSWFKKGCGVRSVGQIKGRAPHQASTSNNHCNYWFCIDILILGSSFSDSHLPLMSKFYGVCTRPENFVPEIDFVGTILLGRMFNNIESLNIKVSILCLLGEIDCPRALEKISLEGSQSFSDACLSHWMRFQMFWYFQLQNRLVGNWKL